MTTTIAVSMPNDLYLQRLRVLGRVVAAGVQRPQPGAAH